MLLPEQMCAAESPGEKFSMELTLSGIGYWSGPWDVLSRKETATNETKTLQKQRGLLPQRCFIKCKINIQRALQKPGARLLE